jgi:hypothetical protein
MLTNLPSASDRGSNKIILKFIALQKVGSVHESLVNARFRHAHRNIVKPKCNCDVVVTPNKPEETTMPVLLIPLLVGVPVVLAGGYWIIHSMH